MTIGERIKQVRAELGMSRADLVRAADIPYPTLAGIENSDQGSSTRLHAIAKALRVRPEWLETGKGAKAATEDVVIEDGWSDIIGVRQAAALGEGAVVDEYAETHKLKFRAESLRRKKLRADRLAVLYGRGDSMAPTIKNGDAILFDTSDIEPRDDKIYVISYEGHLMAKRLVELGGRWFIQSDNNDDPKWRKPVAVDETRQFAIHGRVRWIGSWED
jgi:phage repressor protein C with HTH and peptisase S24 domain